MPWEWPHEWAFSCYFTSRKEVFWVTPCFTSLLNCKMDFPMLIFFFFVGLVRGFFVKGKYERQCMHGLHVSTYIDSSIAVCCAGALAQRDLTDSTFASSEQHQLTPGFPDHFPVWKQRKKRKQGGVGHDKGFHVPSLCSVHSSDLSLTYNRARCSLNLLKMGWLHFSE